MDSLKEFIYYDVSGNQIKNPDHTLQYDKKDDKLLWFDAKNSPAENPKWWVRAENTEEQRQLNKALERGTIAENQIATPGWLNQKQEEAAQKKEKEKKAAELTQDNSTSSPETTNTDSNPAKPETLSEKSDEVLIVDNLVSSGTLQKEITKAIVNTESIPIFPDDIPKISAAIFKALKAAKKSGLFSSEFLTSDGEIINAGQVKSTTADTIVNTILDSYLSISRSPEGKSLFTYTFLPEEESLQEAKKSKKRGSSNSKNGEPSSAGNAKNNSSNPKVENSTTASGVPSSEDQTESPLGNSTKTLVEEPPTQEARSITLANKKSLKTALKNKVTEMLAGALESFKATATSVRFRCAEAGEPLPVETEEPKENPAPQAEETSQKNEKPVQEVKEAIHSNDYCIFTRLVEAEKDEVSTSDETGTGEKDMKEKPTEEAAKENEKPSKEKAETSTFPTAEALKTLVEGLNKAGSSFETDLATYTLSYTLENTDVSSSSFDILVESKHTTPKDKEGFWSFFSKKAGKFLKAAGDTLAKVADVVASDGRMTF